MDTNIIHYVTDGMVLKPLVGVIVVVVKELENIHDSRKDRALIYLQRTAGLCIQ